VAEGGVKAWAAAGLPLTEGRTEYDGSTLRVLGDELEALQAKVGPCWARAGRAGPCWAWPRHARVFEGSVASACVHAHLPSTTDPR
jgi:hypothetical protein